MGKIKPTVCAMHPKLRKPQLAIIEECSPKQIRFADGTIQLYSEAKICDETFKTEKQC